MPKGETDLSKRTEQQETFGYVLKRHMPILVVVSILLVAAIALSGLTGLLKSRNENLYLSSPPVDLGLKPADFLDTEGTEGVLGTVLTETEPVGQEYLDDTLFVGDSFTDGIRLYSAYFGNALCIAKRGVNTHSALTDAFYMIEGVAHTMIDAIEYYKPRRVYLMLGTNGLGWESVEWNLEGYDVLVDEILRRVPGCYVVIQSIPPTTAERAALQPAYSLENIARYNEGLMDLAMRKGIYYLDINAALSNEDGYLDDSIAASDGFHMQPWAYATWSEYILTHAVQGETNYYINSEGILAFSVRQEPATDEADPADTDEDAGAGDDPAQTDPGADAGTTEDTDPPPNDT